MAAAAAVAECSVGSWPLCLSPSMASSYPLPLPDLKRSRPLPGLAPMPECSGCPLAKAPSLSQGSGPILPLPCMDSASNQCLDSAGAWQYRPLPAACRLASDGAGQIVRLKRPLPQPNPQAATACAAPLRMAVLPNLSMQADTANEARDVDSDTTVNCSCCLDPWVLCEIHICNCSLCREGGPADGRQPCAWQTHNAAFATKHGVDLRSDRPSFCGYHEVPFSTAGPRNRVNIICRWYQDCFLMLVGSICSSM